MEKLCNFFLKNHHEDYSDGTGSIDLAAWGTFFLLILISFKLSFLFNNFAFTRTLGFRFIERRYVWVWVALSAFFLFIHTLQPFVPPRLIPFVYLISCQDQTHLHQDRVQSRVKQEGNIAPA